jgi:PHD/YefM family antitoxin component YafN of YafNO toxin-antitoxin module
VIKATLERARIYRLINKVVKSYQPVLVVGKRRSAVLAPRDDWLGRW